MPGLFRSAIPSQLNDGLQERLQPFVKQRHPTLKAFCHRATLSCSRFRAGIVTCAYPERPGNEKIIHPHTNLSVENCLATEARQPGSLASWQRRISVPAAGAQLVPELPVRAQ